MFALLCISIALPSGSKTSTTREATDIRDSQQGVHVVMSDFVSGVYSGIVHCDHNAVNSYTAYCLAMTVVALPQDLWLCHTLIL